MLERHQDYVLRNIGIAGNTTANFIVKLDSDAPFALRSIAASGMGTTYQLTITGLDDRKYVGGGPLAAVDSLLNPNSFFIIYPQIPFPAQGTIQVTVTNLSGGGIDGGVLVFRGTKLDPEGTVFGPQYPPTFSELNFRYGYNFIVPLGSGGTPTVFAYQPLNIQSDADFVVRMLSFYSQSINGVADFIVGTCDVILRDQYGKAYSNDWVPAETLFPTNTGNNVGVGLSFSVPDVTIFPEIYLKANTQLLLDIRRTGGVANSYMQFCLHGSKIFPLS